MRAFLLLLVFAVSVFSQLNRGDGAKAQVAIKPYDGMVQIRSQFNLTPTELSDAQNCDFSYPGEIRCRYGYDAVGTISGNIILGVEGYTDIVTAGGIDQSAYIITMKNGDSLYGYQLGSSLSKSFTAPYGSGFYGMPQIEAWKKGFLFGLPSYTAVKHDSINCIRFNSNLNTATYKIGAPTCSSAVSASGEDYGIAGEEHLTGTYHYAVTFRRQITSSGKTYYEEGNSVIKTISPDDGQRIRLSSIPKLSSQWQGTYDGYQGGWTRRVYRTKANGSTLYFIATIHNDSSAWVDTVADVDVNTFNPVYDEVIDNSCLDSLMSNYYIRGFSTYANRFFVLLENSDAYGLAQSTIYRTIPFTNQTPLLFTTKRQSLIPAGQSLTKTGIKGCAGKLYAYGLNGITEIIDPISNVATEVKITDAPIFGSNCVECVDNSLWALSTKGEIFSTQTGTITPNVWIVDSSEQRQAKQWFGVSNSIHYKTYSLSAIKPFDKTILAAATDSSGAWMGFLNGNGLAWSRFPIRARNLAGSPTLSKLVWVDTITSKLVYWPSKTINQKDYNGTDSSGINWTISTGWMDFGSFDATKQVEKVVVNASLIDTLKIYSYWDGSSTVNDSGQVSSQDTIRSTHSGDCYTWFPKRNNLGRYLKLKFTHPNCGQRKLVFREAKVYVDIVQR